MEESKPETSPAKPAEETKPPETKPPETKPAEKTTRGTLAARMDRLEAKQDSLIGKVDTWLSSQTARAETPKADPPPSTPPKPAVEIIEVQAEVQEKKPPAKTDGDVSQSAETKAGERPHDGGGDGVPPRVRTFADNLFLRPR